MFGLGLWEIVIIAVVALLILGPEKLPSTARQVGRLLREVRRATDDLSQTIHEAVHADEKNDSPSSPQEVATSLEPYDAHETQEAPDPPLNPEAAAFSEGDGAHALKASSQAGAVRGQE